MHRAKYIVFILIQSLVYGIGNPLTKIAFETITPMWCLTFRFIIAFAVIFLLGRETIKAELKEQPVGSYLPAGICMALAYIFCNLALNWTSAVNVGFLMSLPIIFVPVLEKIILQKPYPKQFIFLQIAVLAGLYLLCSNGGSFVFRTGDIFAVLTAVMIAGALVFGEKSLQSLSVVSISAVQLGITAVLSTAGALLFDSVSLIPAISIEALAIVLYLAFFCSCLAYMLQNEALKHLKSATVSLLQCTQPIMTALVAFLMLGEELTASGIAGGGIIIACLIMSNRMVK